MIIIHPYGDLNLQQNETIFIYRIPLDINCPKFQRILNCQKNSIDGILLLIKNKIAIFKQSFNLIINIFNQCKKYIW